MSLEVGSLTMDAMEGQARTESDGIILSQKVSRRKKPQQPTLIGMQVPKTLPPVNLCTMSSLVLTATATMKKRRISIEIPGARRPG
jgi:hypothetical protein